MRMLYYYFIITLLKIENVLSYGGGACVSARRMMFNVLVIIILLSSYMSNPSASCIANFDLSILKLWRVLLQDISFKVLLCDQLRKNKKNKKQTNALNKQDRIKRFIVISNMD